MLGEGTTEIFITFLLAIIGYAGLTVTLLISLRRTLPFLFWRIIAVIILVHVFMVWNYRYSFDFSLAVRNGYGGFLIFHFALVIILVSTFVREKIADILIIFSFIIVTAGAVGASFRYNVVEIYRVPVLIFAVTGMSGLVWRYFMKSKLKIERGFKNLNKG